MQELRDLYSKLPLRRRDPHERFSQEEDRTRPELVEMPAFLPPVPPSLPSAREHPPKSHRDFFVTGATSAAINSMERQTEFGVNSIVINNLSSQWVYLRDVDWFVPPQVFNAVIRGNGGTSFRAIFETPPGITAAAISSASERVQLLLTEEVIPLSPGVGAKTS